MIETPKNVCFSDGLLKWSPVNCADGYNIHSGLDYVITLDGGDVREFVVPDDMPEPYSVSAWVRDQDNVSAHTEKSIVACGLFEPTGELVVDDRFENLDNWVVKFPYWDYDTVINNELQRYGPDAFSFDENGVTITANKDADGNWTSGVLTGPIEQSRIYGFYEWDIKMGGEQGTWPACWLLNTKYFDEEQNITAQPEIDVMEMVKGMLCQHYHWLDDEWLKESNRVIPFIEGFNKYGVDWQEGRLTFYINRVPVFEVVGPHVSSQGMYPIMNLAMGGWAGDPLPELDEAKMTIRSYRVWQ